MMLLFYCGLIDPSILGEVLKLWQTKRHPDFVHHDTNTKVIYAAPSSAKISPLVV
jgi:hypothetical protein